MALLKNVGEHQLVKNIKNIIRPSGILGVDDDAAIVETNDIVVCSDIVTFERHMPETMTYEEFGWTAAAVNFSDLAAMGAEPIGLITSLALPPDLNESCLYDIVRGIDKCAKVCNAFIIGGDTKPGTGIISCTALGRMGNHRPMMRSGAKIGDIVAVTGSLGSPAAGFYAIKNKIKVAKDTVISLMAPTPHIKEGMALAKSGKVTSCIDLSDGLATAASIVCEQSHVGMEIIWEFLPEGCDVDVVSQQSGISKENMMLKWGGEYELMFTISKSDIEALQDCDVHFSVIGYVTGGENISILKDGSVLERYRAGQYWC
ncbi:MAG: thiamine-phosphate kinase [archaeon]|nr:thiamine-phosphate kinase [archaeon]